MVSRTHSGGRHHGNRDCCSSNHSCFLTGGGAKAHVSCSGVAGWLLWLQGLCGLICLLKSAISVLHLVTASQNMAALDAAEREKAAKQQ